MVRKKDDVAIFYLLLLVSPIFGIAWLYEKLGMVGIILLLTSIVVIVYGVYRYYRSKVNSDQKRVAVSEPVSKKKSKGWQKALDGQPAEKHEHGSLLLSAESKKNIKTYTSSKEPFLWMTKDHDVLHWLQSARDARVAGDYPSARFNYQKCAYMHNRMSKEENDCFKKEVAIFAGEDPLYRETMGLIKNVVTNKPGILQSDLTGVIGNQDNKEQLYYVLYYADIRGEIIRTKKGNTYLLTLPGQQLIQDHREWKLSQFDYWCDDCRRTIGTSVALPAKDRKCPGCGVTMRAKRCSHKDIKSDIREGKEIGVCQKCYAYFERVQPNADGRMDG